MEVQPWRCVYKVILGMGGAQSRGVGAVGGEVQLAPYWIQKAIGGVNEPFSVYQELNRALREVGVVERCKSIDFNGSCVLELSSARSMAEAARRAIVLLRLLHAGGVLWRPRSLPGGGYFLPEETLEIARMVLDCEQAVAVLKECRAFDPSCGRQQCFVRDLILGLTAVDGEPRQTWTF